MKKNKLPTDKKERKLTQLLDTHGEFMEFNNYYLWFLIDTCHFVIDEIKEIYVFVANRAFKNFVEQFMRRRLESNSDAESLFYKTNLNAAYGKDILNQAKYTKSKILDGEQTFTKHLAANFVGSRKLSDDVYQVEMLPKSFACNTCTIEGFFTLDNSKFWYLNFIYNFMYKYLDMDKIHFIEGDTDSMYWAVSGSMDEDNKQGFKHVIKDEAFYNTNVYKFFPGDFYSSDNSNPSFETNLERKLFNKKLGGFAIEKQCDCVIALAPKMYTCFNLSDKGWKTKGIRIKGVKMSQNKIKSKNYYEVFKQNIMQGSNSNLQLHNGIISKITTAKNILTAAHTKYKVTEDFSTCVPLFM
jgi:hypothetical protein